MAEARLTVLMTTVWLSGRPIYYLSGYVMNYHVVRTYLRKAPASGGEAGLIQVRQPGSGMCSAELWHLIGGSHHHPSIQGKKADRVCAGEWGRATVAGLGWAGLHRVAAILYMNGVDRHLFDLCGWSFNHTDERESQGTDHRPSERATHL